MISALTGQLKRVDEDRVHLKCGAMLFELLVPAVDATELQASLGEELAGKVQEFASPMTATMRAPTGRAQRSPIEEDAIAALMQLGERRVDAEHLLDRVKQINPKANDTQILVREMLRMRTVRA